jgi:hypothetical protein
MKRNAFEIGFDCHDLEIYSCRADWLYQQVRENSSPGIDTISSLEKKITISFFLDKILARDILEANSYVY